MRYTAVAGWKLEKVGEEFCALQRPGIYSTVPEIDIVGWTGELV